MTMVAVFNMFVLKAWFETGAICGNWALKLLRHAIFELNMTVFQNFDIDFFNGN